MAAAQGALNQRTAAKFEWAQCLSLSDLKSLNYFINNYQQIVIHDSSYFDFLWKRYNMIFYENNPYSLI